MSSYLAGETQAINKSVRSPCEKNEENNKPRNVEGEAYLVRI